MANRPTKSKAAPTGSDDTGTDQPALDIPIPDDGIGSTKYWQDQIDDSVRRRRKEIPTWRRNLQRAYRNTKPEFRGVHADDVIHVPSDFYNVELKKGQLFFQTPYVQLTAEQPDVEQAQPYYQHVLNYLLSAKEANVKRTTEEALVDVLCPSGIGPTKIGYEAVEVDVPVPTGRTQPDPANPLGPGIPVVGDDGQPETTLVKQTIWDRYYWEHFSPAKLLLPVGFFSTRYDLAPWIGMEFEMDPDEMEKRFGITSGSISGSRPDADDSLAPEADREYLRDTATGVEIWYRAYVYDKTVKHPELIRHLILVDKGGRRRGGGDAAVVKHENSPYQRFDPSGKLLQGMRGFPIHPLTIRIVTDTAYPPSDCTIARPLSDEMSQARSMMVKQRRRNIPLRGVNRLALGKDFAQRIERADVQGVMPFDGPVQETDFRSLDQAHLPPENFEINRIIDQDSSRTWGFDNVGALNAEVHSATEVQDVAQVRGLRVAADREHVLDWFLQGVEKFASLPLIYGKHDRVVEILGDDGAARLETWNLDKINGRYAYSIKPDSSVRIDAAQERALTLQSYNLTANSPFFNQTENAKRVARAFNLDANRMVTQPQPPPPEPDKPKISLSFKGEDLNPGAPQYANVITMLKLSGIDGMQPQAQPPQTASEPPGGKVHAAKPMEPVSQHAADLTGQLPNHQTPRGPM